MKRIIAFVLIFTMVFSMTPTVFASTSGGITDFSRLRVPGGFFGDIEGDLYLSNTFTEALLNRLDKMNPTPGLGSIKEIYEFIVDVIANPGWNVAYFVAGKMIDIGTAPIRNANRDGTGIIITFYRERGKNPTIRSQSSPASAVKISLSVSPSEAGMLTTVNTLYPTIGTNVQVTVQRRNGWKFDGWYEGNTKVSDTQTYKFEVTRERTLEARFIRDGQAATLITPTTPTTPSQSQLSVINTVNSEFIVTIPANYTLECFRTATATTRYTWVTARSSSYQIYATKRLTMSDGSTRYFFISGNNNDCYFMFTSSMNVEQYFNTSSMSSDAILEPITSICAGDHSMVIKSDGTLLAWGASAWGTWGDGTTELKKEYPVQILDNVILVSSGGDHHYAIKKDGSLWGWGLIEQWENGWPVYTLEPKKLMDNVITVAAGGNCALVIKSDLSLWLFGQDYGYYTHDNMQILGKAYYTPDNPKKIMDDVVFISTSPKHSSQHCLAVKTDGSLWAWGSNSRGKLGDGTRYDSGIPIKIMDNVESAFAGGNFSAAIKNDGTLWMWGSDSYNAPLVSKITDNNITPMKIMDDVVQVSAWQGIPIILKKDGTVWTWKSSTGRANDLELIEIIDGVISISAEFSHALALKSDGSIWAWGYYYLDRSGVDIGTDPIKVID